MKLLLWEAATAYTIQGWKDAMQKIRDMDPGAADWLEDVGAEKWTRSHFDPSSKCHLLCNNIYESWNSYILKARDKPIITLLGTIRRMVMKRLQCKREKIQKFKRKVCPRIMEKLNKKIEVSNYCMVYFAGDNKFEVLEMAKSYSVDLEKRKCDCKEWELTGISCRHAIRCISHLRRDPEDFCDDYYMVSTYHRVYEGMIYPIPDSTFWPSQKYATISPPHFHRKAGRPKKARRKDANERVEKKWKNKMRKFGVQMTCSKCRQKGHNARGCKNEFVPPPPRVPSNNKGGRPRKVVEPSSVKRVREILHQVDTTGVYQEGAGQNANRGRRRRGRGRRNDGEGGGAGVGGGDGHGGGNEGGGCDHHRPVKRARVNF